MLRYSALGSHLAVLNRWRRYLDYNFFEHQIHSFSILNSFMMVKPPPSNIYDVRNPVRSSLGHIFGRVGFIDSPTHPTSGGPATGQQLDM